MLAPMSSRFDEDTPCATFRNDANFNPLFFFE